MAMRLPAIVSVAALLLWTSAAADEKMNVALTDLQGEGVDASTVRVITDRLRTELFKSGRFTVVERGQMEEILKEQGFQQSGCTSDACVVEVGQILGVKGMLAGSVGKVGSLYTLNVRLIDVGSATITQSVNVDCKCDVEEVLTMSTVQIATQLADAVVGGDGNERARKAVRGAAENDRRTSRGQRVRMWTFGSVALLSGAVGVLMNSFAQDEIDKCDIIASDYERYVQETGRTDKYDQARQDYLSAYNAAQGNVTARNVCYGLAGAAALGLTLSIFF